MPRQERIGSRGYSSRNTSLRYCLSKRFIWGHVLQRSTRWLSRAGETVLAPLLSEVFTLLINTGASHRPKYRVSITLGVMHDICTKPLPSTIGDRKSTRL